MVKNSVVLMNCEKAFPMNGATKKAAAKLAKRAEKTFSQDLVKNISTVIKL